LNTTRLPDKPVFHAIVSGQYDEISLALHSLGINPILTPEDMRLPVDLRYHADMQLCPVGKSTFVLKNSALCFILASFGIYVRETEIEPGKIYPTDVLCNGLVWDGFFLGNPKTIDSSIKAEVVHLNLDLINVRQGYAACSTVLVDSQSAITADKGIANSLEKAGIQVLTIVPGYISLPGYNYGFIGGCCGKLGPNLMGFTGKLSSHPDGQRIHNFLKARQIEIVELSNKELMDIGGIVPVI